MPGRDGVWIAGGYSGHGNVLGLACGELVARALLGDPDPLLDLFAPARLLHGEPGSADLSAAASRTSAGTTSKRAPPRALGA